ncbi:MAG: hypothetical protein IJK23_10310, partial [Clostridia bacterium]|nr:hypothetical protein [Clostridia bacterium]
HTTGMQSIFGKQRELPSETIQPVESMPVSAAKVQKKVGHGYEPEHSAPLPNIPWLKQISSLKLLSDI